MRIQALFTLFAAALPAFGAAAQPNPIEVKTVTFMGSLPYVVSGSPRRDARINHRIFLAMTGTPAPARYAATIKEPEERVEPQPSSNFGFSVLRDDDRVLALEVEAEGCGAYCEHYWTQYVFDAASGRSIFAEDLFTPAGAAALMKRNLGKRLAEYKAAIAGLEKEAAANRKKMRIATPWPQPRPDGKQDEEEARIADTIDMYERCMESMRAPDYGKYSTLREVSLKIDNQSVTFMYGRCSNHAMRALDEVGNQQVAYRIADLAPHFTPYGKYLLMGGPAATPPSTPFLQVLHGRVGPAAVTLLLSRPHDDGSLSGLYFYDKYRQPIALGGKATGKVLELTEYDSVESPKPLIRAMIKGASLEGHWIGAKTLAFRAEP